MTVNTGEVAAALERWNERRRQIFYPKTDFAESFADLRERKQKLLGIDLSPLARILDREVRSIEPMPNAGTFHALFRIVVEDGPRILKLSAECADFGFAIESRASEALRRIGLPALKVEAYDILPGQLPCPFLVIEEATGGPLNRFENADTQALPEPALFELGKTLASIHSIKGAGAGLLDCGGTTWPSGLLPTWRDYVSLHLEDHVQTCRNIKAITIEEAAVITDCFAKFADLFSSAASRLLHGDPGHHNVFFDGHRITAIIDWEDALVGDPVFDIAYWGTFVRDEMRERFLEGYRNVATLPDDFERRYWLYFLRVALSKTVHRHHFGAKDRPGRPPASQRIQKALSKLREL